MYELKERTIQTILGKDLRMLYREGTNDTFVIDSVMVYDEYKSKYFNYRDNDVFIDLGAHISTWGILMASLNPTFKVFSVEATPDNAELSRKNISLNSLNGRITLLQKAISDTDGKLENIFFSTIPMDKFVGSMLGQPDRVHIEVESLSLNTLFEVNNITHCRILKCDCEGAENKAFSTIKPEHLRNIDYIVGEFHPYFGVDREQFFHFFEPYFIDETEKYYGKVEGFGDFLYMNRDVKK